MLLIAPGLPQSRYELDESLLPIFGKGFRHTLEENVQREGVDAEGRLYRMLSRSRPMWLFSRILTFDSTTDYYLFKALWDSIGNYNQEMAEFFRSMQSSKRYTSIHTELEEEDQTPEQVAKREGEYLGKDIRRLAISRKLTLVSEWSSRYHILYTDGIRSNGNVFVADKNLWAWINDCLKS